MRIPYGEAAALLKEILVRRGFGEEDAALSARLFCDANRDGVQSHGLARFGSLLRAIENGLVVPGAEPTPDWAGGALERWNGNRGPGSLNAWRSMARAMELAENNGIGCVALSETNHWMRAGNYGWQAADAGYMAMCWTNTMPNMPPWGSRHPLIGNNPLVVAVPGNDGEAVVLDMAMSQFSWGALGQYRRRGEKLPVPGGYDPDGNLSRNPASIEESGRPLPAGFWKGSGLAILLDLLAAMLSGGRATCDIDRNPESETAISQVFIAFRPPDHPGLVDRVLSSLASLGDDIYYPGRRVMENRRRSGKEGIPVEDSVWDRIRKESPGEEHRSQ